MSRVDSPERVETRRTNGDDFESRPETTGMLAVAASRASQEVQASLVVAKKFPRDEQASFKRIMDACKRQVLAEQAAYEYPRGGTKVTGPSIRLAEVMAQSWGNMQAGVVELERREGESTAMAYCWDLETNFKDEKTFTVRHIRDTKRGAVTLTEERDIYELIANLGARRKRACILAVIPGDVQDAAIVACEKTLAGDNKEPIADRVRQMLAAFDEMSVTRAMIEKRLQHKSDDITEREIIKLRQIYAAIRDGIGSVEQYFELGQSPVDAANDALKNAPKSEIRKPAKVDQPVEQNHGAPPQRQEPPAPAQEMSGAGEEVKQSAPELTFDDGSIEAEVIKACISRIPEDVTNILQTPDVAKKFILSQIKLKVKKGTWAAATAREKSDLIGDFNAGNWPAWPNPNAD